MVIRIYVFCEYDLYAKLTAYELKSIMLAQ